MKFKNIVNAPLSKESINQLKRIMKDDAQNHVRQRAHAILLVFRDQRTFEDVADIFKVHVNTVRNWVTRWSNEGINGIYDLEGRGVKPRFTPVEEQFILDCVDQEPRSLRQVAVMVERKTGKTASIATFRLILKKHGKTWKRKRKIPKGSPSEEALEQGKQDIQELKQLAQDGEFDLLYFDATGFSLVPSVSTSIEIFVKSRYSIYSKKTAEPVFDVTQYSNQSCHVMAKNSDFHRRSSAMLHRISTLAIFGPWSEG